MKWTDYNTITETLHQTYLPHVNYYATDKEFKNQIIKNI